MGVILIWVMFSVLLNESQLNDSLEEFIWGQSFEWGYWKHPPLTTWFMWAVTHAFGYSHLWTYLLAAAFFSGTLWLTWKIANQLMPAPIANWVPILLTLHYGFTRRAQLYNHNAVLIFLIALTVLWTLLALKKQNWQSWVLVGVAAGLSMLTKYQAIIPLTGIVLALALSGELKKSVRGILFATLMATLIFMPHIIWAAHHHFETIKYGLSYVDNSEGPVTQGRFSAFVVTQFRYYLPLIFFSISLWFLTVTESEPQNIEPFQKKRFLTAWLLGLIAYPALIIAILALFFGVRLQSHWGLQITQFLVLFLAIALYKRFGTLRAKYLKAWATVTVLALVVMVAQSLGWGPQDRHNKNVRAIPAAKIAWLAQNYWAHQTACPLTYLGGEASAAAMVSAYSDRHIEVLEDDDFDKSPWIDPVDYQNRGHLQVYLANMDWHQAGMTAIQLDAANSGASAVTRYLILQATLPAKPCPPPGLSTPASR